MDTSASELYVLNSLTKLIVKNPPPATSPYTPTLTGSVTTLEKSGGFSLKQDRMSSATVRPKYK